MSVHYKFKSALDYDTVTFDGLHICIGDLKAAISRQKRIGKTSDFDLQITNAQTKEVYSDDSTLIPKNTSLLVARIPLAHQPKKQWEGPNNQQLRKDVPANKGLADLSRMEGSEQDKINAMISQSTFDYDPSNYLKIRGQNQRGIVPPTYTCYKCNKRGHWIKECPTGNKSEGVDIRRSTGIPRSFMIPVEGPKEPGAMMTPGGTFAVPVVDREAYQASEMAGSGDTPTNAPAAPEPTIPDELVCSLCRDLLTDAVMIPCCGNSFCDECIRGALLESEDHQCPDCREKEIAPTTLIPNRFLRNSVSSFRNQTGYSRRMPHRQPVVQPPPQQQLQEAPLAPGPANMPPPSAQPGKSNDGPAHAHAQNHEDEDSDGSADDNITVTMPPPGAFHRVPSVRPVMPHGGHGPRQPMHRPMRYGPPPGMKPMDMPQMQRLDEQRPSTPTIDERRENMVPQAPFRGPMPFMARGPPPPGQFNPPFNHGLPPPGVARPGIAPPGIAPPGRAPPFPDPHQPPPPGIKDSPTNGSDVDPLEAFNRMIREKEMRARRREEERRRSPSLPRRSPHSPRSPSPRSPRSPPRVRGSRSPPPRVRGSRSPPPRVRPSRSPPPRVRPSRSPPPRIRGSRSPPPRIRGSRSPPPRIRGSRSPPPRIRGSRSPPPRIRGSRSPPLRVRGRSRGPSRPRYTRSRSISPRGRMRRSPPWSPRRRRSRDRSLSLTRSPSPRRRHRSPMRYRSPLRSPPPPRSPLRSPHRTPLRSPPRSPSGRPISPHRYPGVYDELLSPPRRSVEPPYGARYGPRHNNMPPSGYPPMEPKPMPLMGPMQGPPGAPPGYRDRYEGPHRPPFENVPPGVEPPVPGFEPSPFDKPSFGPPGVPIERDRLPPANYREPFRPPFDGPPGTVYREIPVGLPPNDINVHVGQPPRFRENFRPGPFREQAPVPVFREGQPPFREGQPPFRDGQPGFREGQPPYHNREQMPPPYHRDGPPRDFRSGAPPQFRENSFRGHPYRDGAPRENFREGGPPPGFHPPIADAREPVPPNFHDPNFRERFRDEPRRDGRPDYRPGVRSSRGGSRHNPDLDRDRHRERDGRDRERYNENRDPADRSERPRDDKRPYDKSRERHEERREHDRGREHEKDREREKDSERHTPDKKRGTPEKKRSREVREKKISESKDHSRDRDVKKEKKEERIRDKSSTEKVKEPKEKDKKEKVKDRKKKKKEKEKDKESEKKKKKEKKEKKDKDKKEDDVEKSDTKENAPEKSNLPEPAPEKPVVVKLEKIKEDKKEIAQPAIKMENNFEEVSAKPKENLYDDEETEAIDKEIIQNYVKTQENDTLTVENNTLPVENNTLPVENSEDKNVPVVSKTEVDKEEPFDGIELQANADELDLKPDDGAAMSKEMLALLPERSKWEMDDENVEKSSKEPGELSSPEPDVDGGKVTTEVLKRAENAIFTKAINSLRPIEIKKISSDRAKLYTDEVQPKGSIQITVPVSENDHRSIEIGEKKKRLSKTPPPRLSVKDRLGGKVEDVRKTRDSRVIHSTVELVRARSKTPKKEQPYRKVTVDKGRRADSKHDLSKSERRVISSDGLKPDKHRKHSPSKEHRKKSSQEKHARDEIKSQITEKIEAKDSRVEKEKPANERKKSTTLDEANFEPDYDENVESEKDEQKDDIHKKREGSPSGLPESKKAKVEPETIKLDLANVKKKPDTESESSSSGSSSSSEDRKKKKKKKKAKKKKKRAASDSDSDSGSSSDDHKKKKKRKHKKKSSKKKKKKDKAKDKRK